ncbi:hypothetical protein ACFVU2_19880 [Leifsonia sp. NPDC058194]|uniref:hypothetical protein n=1 Tax=Leifsonia sp. NPDC058194 TaxID=3346374 RepID=UPI0036D98CDD
MKIAPLKVSDPWFGRIANNEQIHSDSLTGVPIESTVEMELVELLHYGPEANYRPYLHLRGELTEARPAVELPYGVSELTYRRGAGLPVDAFYDFNHKQLAALVSKGYFSEAFRVPAEMSGIPWTLPGKADFLVVAPELSDEPPVVFMNVHDQTALELDEANSGYELSEYFPDFTAEPEAGEASAEAVAAALENPGASLDVFSDMSFEEHRQPATAAIAVEAAEAEQRAIVPAGVFSRLVSEIVAKQPVEPEIVDETEEEAIVPGSAADVYLSRVEPGVDHVLSSDFAAEAQEAEAETVLDETIEPELSFEAPEEEPLVPAEALTADGFLDLTEPQPELEPLALHLAGTDAEDHRIAAERRAARIRAELEADEATDRADHAEPNL